MRDGFALRCIIKPGASEGDKEPPLDPTVPACLASPTDDWIVLAEVQVGANLVIKNDVRQVVAKPV